MNDNDDNATSQHAFDVMRSLQKVRRQLRYIYLPATITANNLRKAQELIRDLRQITISDSAGMAEAAKTIRETEIAVKDVLEKLDTPNPYHASPQVMTKQAERAKNQFSDRLWKTLRKSNATKKGRRTFKKDVDNMIKGKTMNILGTAEGDFLEGLLTGKSRRLILDECSTGEARAIMVRLMTKYPFDELRCLFHPGVKIGEKDWPSSLSNDAMHFEPHVDQLEDGEVWKGDQLAETSLATAPDMIPEAKDDQKMQQFEQEQGETELLPNIPKQRHKHVNAKGASCTQLAGCVEADLGRESKKPSRKVKEIRAGENGDTGMMKNASKQASTTGFWSNRGSDASTTSLSDQRLEHILIPEPNILLRRSSDADADAEDEDIFHDSVEYINLT